MSNTNNTAANGTWVVICHSKGARAVVLRCARAAGCGVEYLSRAAMKAATGVSDSGRANLTGTEAQSRAFYASIPVDCDGIEGYEWARS